MQEARLGSGEAQFVELRTEALYDLARLRLATRSLQLEGLPVPVHTSELVPRFFSADLDDPYTRTPYDWNERTSQYYSIGPDGIDDDLLLQHDITHGNTRSDLCMPFLTKPHGGYDFSLDS